MCCAVLGWGVAVFSKDEIADLRKNPRSDLMNFKHLETAT
jgi:hypothetical protein